MHRESGGLRVGMSEWSNYLIQYYACDFPTACVMKIEIYTCILQAVRMGKLFVVVSGVVVRIIFDFAKHARLFHAVRMGKLFVAIWGPPVRVILDLAKHAGLFQAVRMGKLFVDIACIFASHETPLPHHVPSYNSINDKIGQYFNSDGPLLLTTQN